MKVDQCYSVILQKIFHQQNLAYPQGTKQETFFVHFQFHRTVLVFPTAHRLSGPSNKLNMGFLRVPWVTFRAWLVTDQFCWTSTWQGGDKRKRIDERGGGGRRLFEGGDYFKYFHQRGWLFEGRLLFEEIRYLFAAFKKTKEPSLF